MVAVLNRRNPEMALNRRAAWPTITATAPYNVDVQSLATLFGVLADARLFPGICDTGFLQTLQWLKAMKLLIEFSFACTAMTGPAAATLRRDNMFEYLEPLTIGLIPTLIVIDW